MRARRPRGTPASSPWGALIDWLPLWLLAGREEKRRGDGGELVTHLRLRESSRLAATAQTIAFRGGCRIKTTHRKMVVIGSQRQGREMGNRRGRWR